MAWRRPSVRARLAPLGRCPPPVLGRCVRFAARPTRVAPCFDPECNASILGKPLPSPRALAPDAQRAVLAHRPMDDSEPAMPHRKSAMGDRERVSLEPGDDARWARLRAACCLTCRFFFAALQGFCFLSGVAHSFLCLLFVMFLFALFSNCSFGGFIAALVGPGQFWGTVGGSPRNAALRASSRRDRLEFAREARRAGQAARFDRVCECQFQVPSPQR
jgi:hypothetical protein